MPCVPFFALFFMRVSRLRFFYIAKYCDKYATSMPIFAYGGLPLFESACVSQTAFGSAHGRASACKLALILRHKLCKFPPIRMIVGACSAPLTASPRRTFAAYFRGTAMRAARLLAAKCGGLRSARLSAKMRPKSRRKIVLGYEICLIFMGQLDNIAQYALICCFFVQCTQIPPIFAQNTPLFLKNVIKPCR